MDSWASVDPDSPADEPGQVSTGDESRFAAEAELAGQLRHALVAGELTAHYQPQYDLASGRIVALEALCRWQHPRQGILPPDRFIYVAEQHGLISDVGRFMLEESGRRAADWNRRGAHVGMSVNISPSELTRDFAERMLARLRALDLPHRTLTVEITESPEILFSRDEVFALETLIDGGVGVSVDDFGVGQASLELVRRLPLTEVKIDKSLVQNDARSIDDLVRACVDLARERDATIVAEGIETQEHFERAMHWTCERGQGYYFSPPLPVHQIEPLVLGAA
jgi:EAL domain-containing protein (putative c-di-GMP-specific phosphodiesterase class I)